MPIPTPLARTAVTQARYPESLATVFSSDLGLAIIPDLDAGNYAHNAAISSLTDLSGRGTTFTQATAGNRPTFKRVAGTYNGRGYANFDGTSDFLSSTQRPNVLFASASYSQTVYVAALSNQLPTDATGLGMIFTNAAGSSSNTGIEAWIDNRSSVSRSRVVVTASRRAVSGQNTYENISASNAIAWDTPFIISNTYQFGRTGDDSRQFIDGVATVSTNTGFAPVSSVPTIDLAIGANGSVPNLYYKGDILAILLFNSLHDDTRRAAVESALTSYFGL